MNHRRTMEGIAAAKAKGVLFGRALLEKPACFENVFARWKSGDLSECKAARILGFSRPTFHKWAHE